MMLMAMRLQKSQLASTLKWTSGSAIFNRDPYIMAGYENFDLMVVGAAGGRSGHASYPVNDPQLGNRTDHQYGAGGGGGSSKRVAGLLKSLVAQTAVLVGSQGTNGPDGTNSSGNGGRGGNSSFGSIAVGYGGYGGRGSTAIWQPTLGGYGSNPDGSQGPIGGQATSSGPTAGTWNNATKEGSGGGGGGGANITYNSVTYSPQAGAGGANSGDGYFAGGEGVQSVYWGGGGGGANINPFTGAGNEDYGSGYNHGRGDGVVALKLS